MKLKEWLTKEDMTMSKFGEIMKCSRATVSRWCNGDRTPSLKTAKEISEVTNGEVGVEDLYEA